MSDFFMEEVDDVFTATANTMDRIEALMRKGEWRSKALLALVFITLDKDGNIALWQAGSLHDVIGLAQTAAQQAMRATEEGPTNEA